LVVAIYLLLLTAMLLIPALAASAQGTDRSFIITLTVYASTLTLCGLSLLILPVHAIRHRPVRRRSVWFPIIASGFLAALLFFGSAIALQEAFKGGDLVMQGILLATLGVWAIWSVVFWGVDLKAGSERTGNSLYRLLIAGSVLELLIAVPANVIVRRRGDCCGGIETGMGICIGVSVMIVALGPSVLILYYKRRKRILPPANLRRN
jgi:hypothetical protein